MNTPGIIDIPFGLNTLATANNLQKLAAGDNQEIDKTNTILKREKNKSTRNSKDNVGRAIDIYHDLIMKKKRSLLLRSITTLDKLASHKKDIETVISLLEASLDDCGNYQPAIEGLRLCYLLVNPAKVPPLEEHLVNCRKTDLED
jgi:hypothetical protein